MRHLSILLMVGMLGLAACEKPSPDPKLPPLTTTTAAEAAKAYFEALPEGLVTLDSSPEKLNDAEKKTLEWLNSAIKRAQGMKAGSFTYRLRKGKTGDASAYALKRYAAQSKAAALDASKTYIQVQFIPNGLACPEHHGVIDLTGANGVELLSFWTEGG